MVVLSIREMKVTELKQELRRRGVTTGNKQQLVQKLQKLLKAEALATDDDSDNSYNSDDTVINLKRPVKDCRPKKNSYLKLLNYIQRLESKVRFLEISLSKFKKRTERGILSEHKTKGENGSNNAVPITNNGAAVISKLRCESQQKERKNKILIISDSQGRDISKMARKNFENSDYEATSIVKPNGLFEYVVEDIGNLTNSFTRTDYVIILAGTNNALRGVKLNEVTLKQTFINLKHTNAIVLGVPYWKNRVVLNKFAYDINLQLYNEIIRTSPSSMFVETSSVLGSYIRNGLHINYKEKFDLTRNLCDILTKNEAYLGDPKFFPIEHSTREPTVEDVTGLKHSREVIQLTQPVESQFTGPTFNIVRNDVQLGEETKNARGQGF
ncbi:hypothetical protein QE152_g10089 [Popillia japonica]|uniref:SAP domain-containing protein n=1 Tax=Popillia japonica TaxID=7064 RepID=A0AAW1LSS6_POPJA